MFTVKELLLASLFFVLSLGGYLFVQSYLLFDSSSASMQAQAETIYPIATVSPVLANQRKANDDLKAIVDKYTHQTPATLGVGIKNLTTGAEYYLNPETVFVSASLYKLVVMYGVFYEDKNGNLDASDPTITRQLTQMITVSSNEAAVALAERIGWSKLGDLAKKLGLKNTSLNNPMSTTPKDITTLLSLIASGQALDLETSEKMTQLLLGQRLNDRIPHLLPPEVKVAHKTGELDDVRHDAGIVFAPHNTYLLTLMSKNMKSEEQIKKLMAALSLEIYQYFEKNN